MEDFASLLSRVASNDPSMFEMVLRSWTRGLPSDRAELVQRVVAALATNTHVKSVQFRDLQLTEAESVPLAELLKRRDFEQLDLAGNKLTGEILLPALAARNSLRVLWLSNSSDPGAIEELQQSSRASNYLRQACSG
eukprot:TRINITY_DN3540_c0_g1_i11.p1 TRINITY_DN3540_c0_g1~~TRINITY_DN3540_c0_g1_i11.p1  ORF type:complete len:137 (+),score=40.15 TRINITY_DN3540_c0_g1_i11:220-630(+)